MSFGEDLHPWFGESMVISIWLGMFPLLELFIHKTTVSVLAQFQRFLSELHFVRTELKYMYTIAIISRLSYREIGTYVIRI